MQIRQKYLNDPLCKSGAFSLNHSKTFDVSHSFLPLIVTKLSTLKQVRFFGTTLYYCYVPHNVFQLLMLRYYCNAWLWNMHSFIWAFKTLTTSYLILSFPYFMHSTIFTVSATVLQWCY